jgi:hypothetical protein
MNTDPMNNNVISIDQISSEQYPPVDNQQDQNLTQNGTEPREIDSGIKQAKKAPTMNPTRLYASFFFFSHLSLKYLI